MHIYMSCLLLALLSFGVLILTEANDFLMKRITTYVLVTVKIQFSNLNFLEVTKPMVFLGKKKVKPNWQCTSL